MENRLYPKEGEVFEMTGDFNVNTPEKLLKVLGRTENCEYEGTPLTGIQTAKFKLQRAGGFDAGSVRCYIQKNFGEPARGQWILVFKENFPFHDNHWSIGCADESWRSKSPANSNGVLVIGTKKGAIHLEYEGDNFSSREYMWLVLVE